jgi:membrane dipeptidase
MQRMRSTFPPGLGYELGARFVAPEQLEEIVQTLQGWGSRDDDLAALLGGNLLRLARTVWKAPAGG